MNSTKNRFLLDSNVSFAAAAAVAVATVAAVADDVAAIVAVLVALAVAASAKTYVFYCSICLVVTYSYLLLPGAVADNWQHRSMKYRCCFLCACRGFLRVEHIPMEMN